MTSNPLATALERAIKFRQRRLIPTLDLLDSTPLSAPDLFSNDYLSITRNSSVRSKALKLLLQTDLILGSGGSQVLNGNTSAHVAFESHMKDFFGFPSALLCNSSYDANIAFWRSVPQEGDAIVFDKLVHASTRDGMAGCHARTALYPFQHNSISSFRVCLLQVLELHSGILSGESTVFIAVESLYSMDGDFAPLHDIVQVTNELVPQSGSHIMVDEAHATGIYGPQGRGLVAALHLSGMLDTVLHTFSKARAASGGVILTSEIVRQYIINYGQAFIFSASMPRALMCILNASLDHIESCAGDEGREHLCHISEYFCCLLDEALRHVPPDLLSLRPRDTPQDFPSDIISPIFPILTQHSISLSAHLRQFGYACTSIPYPAVPRGEERIRVVVHAENSPEELKELVSRMLQWVAIVQGANDQPLMPPIRHKL